MKSRIRQKSFANAAPLYLGGASGFLLLVVLASLLLIVGVIRPQALSGLKVVSTDIVTPMLSVLASPFQKMAEAVGNVSGVSTLRAENAQLKDENARLKEWYQTAIMLDAENKSLQKLLNLKVSPAHKFVTARIISDAGNAYVKTVLVKSGELDGVKKNQAVLADEGLIGRIIETGQKYSRVLLINDINSRIPVLIENTQQKAVITGDNSDQLLFKHLPKDTSLVEGARVVTSGDGGVFPAGLPIGRISKNGESFVVNPYSDVSHSSYVRVLNAPIDENLILGNLSLNK